MKILFSEIKKWVPGIKADVKQVAHFLTMAGFMTESVEEVPYQKRKDHLLTLEVRHNRPDCLSVLGIAGEVAARWDKKLVLPKLSVVQKPIRTSNIEMKDAKFVKRVLAWEIEGIKNQPSPSWLKEYLALYGMNSKNFLVDLSNYVMILTGYPSHLLDKEKLQGKLCWDVNKNFSRIVTLDGTEIELKKKDEIILRDQKNILALAGLVGGQKAEIDLETENIIAEMGIYDAGTVRRNGVSLKVNTEAGNRLSKHLDPNGLDLAMNWLLDLIVKNLGDEKTRIKFFSYYPKKYRPNRIVFDPLKPKKYAGIEITQKESLKILESLNFKVGKIASGKKYRVTPPLGRMDVCQEEDLIEEVIRLKGFEKIPSDRNPKLTVVKNITPPVVNLADKVRLMLVSLGLDEVLSSPLIRERENERTNYSRYSFVKTLNSVNEDFPDLRISMASGLLDYLKEANKKNLKYARFFEIGKIFQKNEKKYQENNSLGILWGDGEDDFSLERLRQIVERVLRSFGNFEEIDFCPAEIIPPIANSFSCFDLLVRGRKGGIIYKLKPEENRLPVYFAEIDLDQMAKTLLNKKRSSIYELKNKLVVLDANIELERDKPIAPILKEIERKISRKYFWNIEIKDIFPLKSKKRYTLSVSYKELDDQKAKDLHLKTFGLK